MSKTKMLTVKLVRSPIGYEKSQGDTAKALGLRKLNATVTVPDTPSVRGQIFKIRHLVEVTESKEASK
ncbi:MAG: 50S ribosomal protein L30 [Chloroflexota bacterium]|nr:MAG: 50S ribosomal protein L30 [Chloroflexota bacterium]